MCCCASFSTAESASQKWRKVGGLDCKSALNNVTVERHLSSQPTLAVPHSHHCVHGYSWNGQGWQRKNFASWISLRLSREPSRQTPLCLQGRELPGLGLYELTDSLRLQSRFRIPSCLTRGCPAKAPCKLLWTELLFWWLVLQNFVPCISNVVETKVKEILDRGSCSFCNCGLFILIF